jgi:hypothetical protein
MSLTASRPGSSGIRSQPGHSRPFTAARGLAIFGGLVAVYEVITWVRWLAAGPTQITQYRNHGDAAWTVAQFYEVAMLLVVIALSVKIVRECRSQRRMTMDAKLLVGGLSALFWDPFGNFVAPSFFYNSDWLNLNSWTGSAPGVINSDASRMPEPVFIMFVYPFGLIAFTMIANAIMRAAARRWPGLSGGWILLIGGVSATLCGMLLEAPMFLLHLWALPGAPKTLALFNNGHRYPAVEYLTTGLVFAGYAAVRYFKDDAGLAFTERGVGTGGSLLAIVGWCSALMLVLQLTVTFFSFHAAPYPQSYPRDLVNGMCNVGTTQHTRYGPCPGSPGFRLPEALPGHAPYS